MNEKSILQGLVTPSLIALAFAAGFSTHWAMVRTSGGAVPLPPTAQNELPAGPAVEKPDQPAALPATAVEPPATADKPPTSTPLIDVWPGRHLFIEVEGQWLSQPAKDLIREIRPGGVLLRTENIDSVTQTLALVREIKEADGLGRRQMSDLPIVALALTEGAALDMAAGASTSITELASASSVDPARELGRTLASALKDRGINVLFGPVLDVGGEAPVDSAYQTRVISRDRIVTAAMGLAETDELLRAGVLCAVATFPGYSGATRGPLGGLVLAQDTQELAELLYPFSAAAANRVPGIVVGHVAVPAVDNKHPKRLASQSPKMVQELLRGLWSFDGVVVGDDVTSALLGAESTPGVAAVEAVVAGCDAVIIGSADAEDIRSVCAAISGAVADGKVSESALADSKRRLDAWIARLESPTGLEGILPELPGSLLRVAKAEDEAAAPASPQPTPIAQDVTQVEAPELSPTSPPTESATDSELKLPESGKLEEAQGEYQAVQSPVEIGEQPPSAIAVETTSAQTPSPPEPSPSELVVAAQPDQANGDTTIASPAPEMAAPAADTVTDAAAPSPETASVETSDASSDQAPATDQLASESTRANSAPPLSTEILREVVPAAIGDPTIVPDVAQVAPTDAEAEAAGKTDTAPAIAEGEKADASALEIEDTLADAAANPAPPADSSLEIPEQPPAPPTESVTSAADQPSTEPAPAAPDEIEMTHLVLPGETIMEIATNYGVQASDIQAWNELPNLNVEFGKALKLRVKPDVAERIRAEEAQRPPEEFEETAHVVASGETLTSIAAAYGVQIRDLVRWNGLTDSRLQVGNELKVYRGPGAETIEAAKPATTTYQVKKGDTLTQIARRFGVTPQDILNANNLDDPNKVIVGQRLTIPVKE